MLYTTRKTNGIASLVEGANGGTQFSVNCYFSGQISVNYTIVLANSQLTTNFGLLITFTFMQRILFRHNPNFSSLLKSRYKFTWTLPLVQFISNWKYKSYNHQYDTSLIDPDAPVMISYWSFRHGHACPAINYFKVTFFGTFIIWSESVLYLSWLLLYVLYRFVGLSFNQFLILAIHCNRWRETLSTPKCSLK